jgi:hypothetical protein
MKSRCITSLVCLSLLAGCVTASPDRLLSAEPQGAAQKSGQYPIIGHVPVGQTSQMTPTQKAELKAELARDSQLARGQAGGSSQSDYLAEVKRLKELAQERLDSLTNRIEGDSNGEDGAATQ